jgi:hypothetical protein
MGVDVTVNCKCHLETRGNVSLASSSFTDRQRAKTYEFVTSNLRKHSYQRNSTELCRLAESDLVLRENKNGRSISWGSALALVLYRYGERWGKAVQSRPRRRDILLQNLLDPARDEERPCVEGALGIGLPCHSLHNKHL